MAWIVLIASGIPEAVWAALDESDGFGKPGPTAVSGVAVARSMTGLAFAVRSIPLGTAYGIWVGIGAVSTVTYVSATGAGTVSITRIALLAGIVGCAVGLTLLH